MFKRLNGKRDDRWYPISEREPKWREDAVENESEPRQERVYLRKMFNFLPGHGWLCWSAILTVVGLTWCAVARFLWLQFPASTGEAPELTAVLVILLVLLAFPLHCVRRLRLRFLARRYGPLRIVLDEVSAVEDVEVEELRGEIATKLAQAKLFTVSMLPGNRAQQGFVNLVQDAVRHGQVWNLIAGLLRMAWPDHAYRLHLTMKKEADAGRVRATGWLEVLTDNSLQPPVVISDDDCRSAIEKAAVAATAQILPWASNTRLKKAPAWTDWIDRRIPPGLLGCYLHGKRMVRDERYEEALSAFFLALDEDMGNLHVRLDIAGVYEKLSLWLHAVDMYESVRELAQRRLRWMARDRVAPLLWVRTLGLNRASFRWRAQRLSCRQAFLLADIRRAVLYSWGENLAKQFFLRELAAHEPLERRPSGLRLEEFDILRDRVLARLEVDDNLKSEAFGTRPKHGILSGQFNTYKKVDCDAAALVFSFVGLTSAARIAIGKLGYWGWERRIRRRYLDITSRSLRLLEISAANKYDRQCRKVRESGIEARVPPSMLPLWKDPIPPEKLREAVEQAMRWRWKMGWKPRWIDYYYAACVYADHLHWNSNRSSTELDRHLVESAVERLKITAETMDRTLLTSYRPWFRSEDPDLDLLRRTDAFLRFLDVYLPQPKQRCPRPLVWRKYEESWQSAKALCEYSLLFAQWWRDLGSRCHPGSRAVVDEWDSEIVRWEKLVRLAECRDRWQERSEIMQESLAWARANGYREPCLKRVNIDETTDLIRGGGEASEDVPREQMCTKAEEHEQRIEERVGRILRTLDEVAKLGSLMSGHGSYCGGELRNLYRGGHPIDLQIWRGICRRQAELWRYVQGNVQSVLGPNSADFKGRPMEEQMKQIISN